MFEITTVVVARYFSEREMAEISKVPLTNFLALYVTILFEKYANDTSRHFTCDLGSK